MREKIIHEWQNKLTKYKIVEEFDSRNGASMGYHFYDFSKNMPQLGWTWNESDLTDELAKLVARVKKLEKVLAEYEAEANAIAQNDCIE